MTNARPRFPPPACPGRLPPSAARSSSLHDNLYNHTPLTVPVDTLSFSPEPRQGDPKAFRLPAYRGPPEFSVGCPAPENLRAQAAGPLRRNQSFPPDDSSPLAPPGRLPPRPPAFSRLLYRPPTFPPPSLPAFLLPRSAFFFPALQLSRLLLSSPPIFPPLSFPPSNFPAASFPAFLPPALKPKPLRAPAGLAPRQSDRPALPFQRFSLRPRPSRRPARPSVSGFTAARLNFLPASRLHSLPSPSLAACPAEGLPEAFCPLSGFPLLRELPPQCRAPQGRTIGPRRSLT